MTAQKNCWKLAGRGLGRRAAGLPGPGVTRLTEGWLRVSVKVKGLVGNTFAGNLLAPRDWEH